MRIMVKIAQNSAIMQADNFPVIITINTLWNLDFGKQNNYSAITGLLIVLGLVVKMVVKLVNSLSKVDL